MRGTFLIGALGLLLASAVHEGSAQTWTADNGNGTYTNPLFYDEFADPDIIRVGQDFYLTGSSMHVMPGLPVLHSRDLVNWDFESYALDKLNLGPEYRLEESKDVYGQGIWAPSFRYHDGMFYIFANVNGKTTQMFRSTSARGPWTRTPMKRSFHDLSVLFDDDGKVYVVWGYRDIQIAELDAALTDILPGSERLLIPKESGMGEGSHFYKIKDRYYITSAWYVGVMRLVMARADKLTGPWEVNRNISAGEQFGQVLGWRLSSFRPPLRRSRPTRFSRPTHPRSGEWPSIRVALWTPPTANGGDCRWARRTHSVALPRFLQSHGRKDGRTSVYPGTWEGVRAFGPSRTRARCRSRTRPTSAATTSPSRGFNPSGNGTTSRSTRNGR